MNIVWLAPEPPVPPLTGGRERSRRVLDYLGQRHTIHLVTFAAPEERPALADLRQSVSLVTPVPYPARWGRISHHMRRAVEQATRCRPDVVHAQGLDMARYAPTDTGIRSVLELYDVPHLLNARLLDATPSPRSKLWRAWSLACVRRREAIALRRASAVIVVSEQDQSALASAHAARVPEIVLVPNGVDLDYWTPPDIAPDPCTLLFPGALNWSPNVDAARVLARSVLPRVRASLPQARAIIAGRRPGPDLRALARSDASLTLVADPADMRPIFARSTVVVVPLRAASGTRLKILQALAVERPVVSTAIGAEGLGLRDGVHLALAPLVRPFGDALVHLLTNPARRAKLVAAGRAIIQRHAWENCLPRLDAIYPGVL